jgi:6-phosphogluconolactonase
LAGLQTYANEEQLAIAAAEHFVAQAGESLERSGRFSVALSGGSTPRAAFELLAQSPYVEQVRWEQVHVFWCDERCVPPDHPDSNYGMARAALLNRVPLPGDYIYRMRGEIDPQQAAAEYDALIREFFEVGDPAETKTPLFDLVWMGMGSDGHTASLFPGDPAVEITDRWAAAVSHPFPPEPVVDRITLTIPAFRRVHQMTFVISGADKSDPLRRILQPKPGIDPPDLPAARVWPESDNVLWLADNPAAGAFREGEM